MAKNASNQAILAIPVSAEDAAAFRFRIASLVQCEKTHIYIDTSFLMWMTKIGSASRKELTDWLKQNCSGRVHVPIWSAHEYLKHHVSRSITQELAVRTKEVQGIVGRSYAYFRPFLDSAFDEGDPAEFRAEARRALEAVREVADKIGRWKKSYERNALDVISFINQLVVERTSIYNEFENIEQLGHGRYMGLVPPGYRDRSKERRGRTSQEPDISDTAGTNVYGDLIFWKEILCHAGEMDAGAMVVITNDRKNDWYMGGGDNRGLDETLRKLKTEWKPVPRPHPMLVTEARVVAKVPRLELLDSAYLAAVLRDVAEQDVRAFVDVAIVPDVEVASGDPDSERPGEREDVDVSSEHPIGLSPVAGFVFPSTARILNGLGHFRKALLASRKKADDVTEKILLSWRTGEQGDEAGKQELVAEAVNDFSHTELAILARELHDRVIDGVAGYQEALVDLVLRLDELPQNTAAALYLGLLSSMYMSRKENDSHVPPSSPVAKLMLARQSKSYALNGVRVVSKRLKENECQPLYVPSVECPLVPAELDVEPEASASDQLRSLVIAGTEVLVAAQADEELRLSVLFGNHHSVDGDRIVRKACELFVIPYDQVKAIHKFKQEYRLTDMIGFKRASDVVIRRDDQDD